MKEKNYTKNNFTTFTPVISILNMFKYRGKYGLGYTLEKVTKKVYKYKINLKNLAYIYCNFKFWLFFNTKELTLVISDGITHIIYNYL